MLGFFGVASASDPRPARAFGFTEDRHALAHFAAAVIAVGRLVTGHGRIFEACGLLLVDEELHILVQRSVVALSAGMESPFLSLSF